MRNQDLEEAASPPDDRQQHQGDTDAPPGARGNDPGPPEDFEETIRQIEQNHLGARHIEPMA
jgi:hypothetical protein